MKARKVINIMDRLGPRAEGLESEKTEQIGFEFSVETAARGLLAAVRELLYNPEDSFLRDHVEDRMAALSRLVEVPNDGQDSDGIWG